MTRGWTIPASHGMRYNPSGVQGPQPLYCLPALLILYDKWDFTKRGRGQAYDLTTPARYGSK